MSESARQYDQNGWMEVKGNPISKVGVFPYRGSMIDPSGAMGLDPEGVYQVYRSAEELSSPETIESFKLVPWIDDHLMLGENFDPAEDKGIQGTLGEDIYFEDGFLRGNLKLWSNTQAQKVEDGKRELSCGYRCEYELKEGIFGDQKYTVAQTNIRGNHLASVDEGRMGSEVAVLDHMTFAVDSKDFEIMAKSKTLENFATDGVQPEEVGTALQLIATRLVAMDADDDEKGEDADDDEKGEDNEDADRDLGQDEDDDKAEDEYGDEKKAEDGDDDEKKAEDGDDDDKGAMDAMDAKIQRLERGLRKQKRTGMKSMLREIGKRDALYAQVSPAIGAFAHDEMTTDEIATYACDKLGLTAPKGQEVTAIDAYFVNRQAPTVYGADSVLSKSTGSDSGKVSDYFASEA